MVASNTIIRRAGICVAALVLASLPMGCASTGIDENSTISTVTTPVVGPVYEGIDVAADATVDTIAEVAATVVTLPFTALGSSDGFTPEQRRSVQGLKSGSTYESRMTARRQARGLPDAQAVRIEQRRKYIRSLWAESHQASIR